MAKPHIGGILSVDAGSVFNGTYIPAEGPHIIAETSLWAAVVSRAWSDAFLASDIWLYNSQRGCDPSTVRAEARRWLILDFGDWRDDREAVCLAADLSPDMIRDGALRRIDLARIEDKARREKQQSKLDQAFEELLQMEERGDLTKNQMSLRLRGLAIRETQIAC